MQAPEQDLAAAARALRWHTVEIANFEKGLQPHRSAGASSVASSTAMKRLMRRSRCSRHARPVVAWGRPEDIAAAAYFPASGESSFVTGVDLPVDGGLGQV